MTHCKSNLDTLDYHPKQFWKTCFINCFCIYYTFQKIRSCYPCPCNVFGLLFLFLTDCSVICYFRFLRLFDCIILYKYMFVTMYGSDCYILCDLSHVTIHASPHHCHHLRTPSLIRKHLGTFFSQLLHFAWTGKKHINGKNVTALSKVIGPAMAELMDNLLKACLPNFSTVQSSETLVDRLHCFLEQQGQQGANSASSSTGRSSRRNTPTTDDDKLKALVFFATEGLAMKPMAEGDDNKEFGVKLKALLTTLQQ